MKTFCTILFFLSLTFFSFNALVSGIFNADMYSFSLPDTGENSQLNGHLLNLDHENEDQVCNQCAFDFSPGKGILIVSIPSIFYDFATLHFTWNPPEKLYPGS
jgi:hypothetical protein